MRRRWALIGAVALTLTLTPVRAGAASAYQQVLRVYEQEGSVPSCWAKPVASNKPGWAAVNADREPPAGQPPARAAAPVSGLSAASTQ
jgi:hypothetical protein